MIAETKTLMNQSGTNIDSKLLTLFHQHETKQTVKTHEILIHPGEECNSIYFVVKGGFLRRFYNESSSVFRTISFHLPNHRPFMTLNESYFAKKPSFYEIKAFQQSEILSFRRELVEKMSKAHPFLQDFHNAWVLESLIFENEFKSRLISFSSKEFYAYLCDEYPEIIKQVPSKYIADVMRISPEWLSKLKQKR